MKGKATVVRRRLRETLVCSYCRDKVDRGQAVGCGRSRCGARYHEECWQECSQVFGGCAVLGCSPDRSAVIRPPFWRRRRVWALASVALLVGGSALGYPRLSHHIFVEDPAKVWVPPKDAPRVWMPPPPPAKPPEQPVRANVDHLALAERAFESRSYHETIGEASLAIEHDPSRARAFDLRGYATIRTLEEGIGLKPVELERALSDLDRAIALEPREASYWYHRALAHQANRDPDCMIRDLERSIELAPDAPDAEFARSRLEVARAARRSCTLSSSRRESGQRAR